MTSSRPYLVRAVYEWITDNGLTPYLLVNAQFPGVHVPDPYVQDGKIVINLSQAAVRGLQLGNDWIELDTRFGGTPMHVSLPMQAVMAIYAKENGQGMVFNEGTGGEPPVSPPPGPKRPDLKLVK
jgi:stringent starvation protein B